MNQNTMMSLLDRFPDMQIAVLGDIMLDVYVWGQVNRISPEAPVPVMQVDRSSCCLGGAANVIRNLTSLGAGAAAFGITGNDEPGQKIREEFRSLGADCSGVLALPGRRTTVKRRLLAGSQQLLRVDQEDTAPLAANVRSQLTESLLSGIRGGKLQAVIFDDYAKGVLCSSMLQEIVQEAEKQQVTTVLDPKPKNREMHPVQHLSLLKPNRSEAFALAGCTDPGAARDPQEDKPLQEVAAKLLELWQPKELIISLAAHGMAIFDASGKMQVIPTRAREVYDVSGAGDTVAAVCTLALAAGASPENAADIANRAAGVVVGKIGTAPITRAELQNALRN